MFFSFATALSSHSSIEVPMYEHSFSKIHSVEISPSKLRWSSCCWCLQYRAACALPTASLQKGESSAGCSHTSDCRQGSSGLWLLEKVIYQRVGLELIMSLRLRCLIQLQPFVNKEFLFWESFNESCNYYSFSFYINTTTRSHIHLQTKVHLPQTLFVAIWMHLNLANSELDLMISW